MLLGVSLSLKHMYKIQRGAMGHHARHLRSTCAMLLQRHIKRRFQGKFRGLPQIEAAMCVFIVEMLLATSWR